MSNTLHLVGPPPSYHGMKLLEQACRDAGVSDYRWVTSVDHVASDFMVCMDNKAMQAMVLDAPNLIEARGYFWDVTEYCIVCDAGKADSSGPHSRIMASMHPDDCNNQWVPYRKLLEVDLQKAQEELDADCPPFPRRDVLVITNQDELLQLYQEIDGCRHIALDIENDKNLDLSCLGVGISANLAFVIPAGAEWQMEAIKDICENK